MFQSSSGWCYAPSGGKGCGIKWESGSKGSVLFFLRFNDNKQKENPVGKYREISDKAKITNKTITFLNPYKRISKSKYNILSQLPNQKQSPKEVTIKKVGVSLPTFTIYNYIQIIYKVKQTYKGHSRTMSSTTVNWVKNQNCFTFKEQTIITAQTCLTTHSQNTPTPTKELTSGLLRCAWSRLHQSESTSHQPAGANQQSPWTQTLPKERRGKLKGLTGENDKYQVNLLHKSIKSTSLNYINNYRKAVMLCKM